MWPIPRASSITNLTAPRPTGYAIAAPGSAVAAPHRTSVQHPSFAPQVFRDAASASAPAGCSRPPASNVHHGIASYAPELAQSATGPQPQQALPTAAPRPVKLGASIAAGVGPTAERQLIANLQSELATARATEADLRKQVADLRQSLEDSERDRADLKLRLEAAESSKLSAAAGAGTRPERRGKENIDGTVGQQPRQGQRGSKSGITAEPGVDEVDTRLNIFLESNPDCPISFRRLNQGFYAFRTPDDEGPPSAERCIALVIVKQKLMVKYEASTHDPGWHDGRPAPIERFARAFGGC